jgi:hypothetical protein
MKCPNCGNEMVESKAGHLCISCGHIEPSSGSVPADISSASISTHSSPVTPADDTPAPADPAVVPDAPAPAAPVTTPPWAATPTDASSTEPKSESEPESVTPVEKPTEPELTEPVPTPDDISAVEKAVAEVTKTVEPPATDEPKADEELKTDESKEEPKEESEPQSKPEESARPEAPEAPESAAAAESDEEPSIIHQHTTRREPKHGKDADEEESKDEEKGDEVKADEKEEEPKVDEPKTDDVEEAKAESDEKSDESKSDDEPKVEESKEDEPSSESKSESEPEASSDGSEVTFTPEVSPVEPDTSPESEEEGKAVPDTSSESDSSEPETTEPTETDIKVEPEATSDTEASAEATSEPTPEATPVVDEATEEPAAEPDKADAVEEDKPEDSPKADSDDDEKPDDDKPEEDGEPKIEGETKDDDAPIVIPAGPDAATTPDVPEPPVVPETPPAPEPPVAPDPAATPPVPAVDPAAPAPTPAPDSAVPPSLNSAVAGVAAAAVASNAPLKGKPPLSPVTHPKPFNLGLILGIVVAVVVVAVAGAAGYLYAYAPTPALANYAKHATAAKTSTFDLTTTQSGGDYRLAIKLNGKYDVSNTAKPKVDVAISGEMSADKPLSSSEAAPSGTVAGQAILLDQNLYFKLGNLSALGSLLPSQLANQWYKVDLNKQSSTNKCEDQSQAISAALGKDVMGSMPVKNAKFVGIDSQGGFQSLHYSGTIDNAKLKTLVEKANQKLSAECKIDTSSSDSSTSTISYQLWRGWSKDRLKLSVKDSKSKEVTDVTLDTYNYNKPVTIKAPDGAKDAADLFSGVLGAAIGPVTEPAPVAPKTDVAANNATRQADLALYAAAYKAAAKRGFYPINPPAVTVSATDPATGQAYVVSKSPATTLGQIDYRIGGSCTGRSRTPGVTGSRQLALYTLLEGTPTPYCVDVR